jgi:hypothetical protein
MGRGARSINNLSASESAVWSHADRQEGDFIDRTGIVDEDDNDEGCDEIAVREDSVEIGDIDIDDIEDGEDDDDDDTATFNTAQTNDVDDVDGGSPKRQRLEY